MTITKAVLTLDGISMVFGQTKALNNMSIELFEGEVHAIVGENGAGKSTMIKIMTGIYEPTLGSVKVDGHPVKFRNSQDARKGGVAAIFQEPMVFPDLDVAENIFISSTNERAFQNWSLMRSRAKDLIAQIGIELDEKRIGASLSVAEQQVVEIARAISQDVRVLIMDEPTAALSAQEAQELRNVAVKLAEQGVAVVYISHRLEEVFEIAHRVTVIRDGQHISTLPINEVSSESLISDMVGREVGNYLNYTPNPVSNETILAVSGFGLQDMFSDINFKIKRGEVLCMAGLIGARRTEVALSLFGILPATQGEIEFKGKPLKVKKPQDAMKAGIAYVTEDRRKYGLALSKHIYSNISLANIENFKGKFFRMNRNQEIEVAKNYRERLNIRTPDVFAEVGNLSGGNQQKVMLAKWLETNPELLIIDEPTRGIDIGAKAEVHELVREFAKNGGAALIISSDLPEVLALGDRILVMREGKQCAILDNEDATSENVMALATGQNEYEAVQ